MTKRLSSLTNDEINQTQNSLGKAILQYRLLAKDYMNNEDTESAIGAEYSAKQMERASINLDGLRPKEPVIRKEIKAVHEGGEFTYVFEYTYYDDEIVSQELIFWFFGGLADFDLDDIETLNLRGQLKAEF